MLEMILIFVMIIVMMLIIVVAYILKAKKFAESPFQSKKLLKKCGSFLVYFGSFLGHFG